MGLFTLQYFSLICSSVSEPPTPIYWSGVGAMQIQKLLRDDGSSVSSSPVLFARVSRIARYLERWSTVKEKRCYGYAAFLGKICITTKNNSGKITLHIIFGKTGNKKVKVFRYSAKLPYSEDLDHSAKGKGWQREMLQEMVRVGWKGEGEGEGKNKDKK